jgi:hypothetical protein
MNRLSLTSVALLLALPGAMALAQKPLVLHHHDAAHQPPGTIVVPASDFYLNIPDGDSNDGRFPAGTWFFNNNTINLGVADDVAAKVPVKESGVYHLYVRSIGTPTSSFHVKIDGREDSGTYGQGKLAWQRGGDYTLKGGSEIEVRLTSVHPRPSLNVLVLSKNADFKEDDLKALELPPEVKLLHEYTIASSNIVKFGDVDGSGKYAILDITSDYSTIMYANDGHELWRWTAPPTIPGESRGNEAGAILWDFHHTGRDELAHWRQIDGKEWLVLADGRTGDIIKKVPWPSQPLPHVDNNFRMAVAKFHKDSDGPDTLLVLSDTGGLITLTAYDKDLNQLWQHAEHRAKDYFGHYIYPYDVNGDGIDEVTISHLCLDAEGHEVWNNAKYFEELAPSCGRTSRTTRSRSPRAIFWPTHPHRRLWPTGGRMARRLRAPPARRNPVRAPRARRQVQVDRQVQPRSRASDGNKLPPTRSPLAAGWLRSSTGSTIAAGCWSAGPQTR